MQFPECQLHLVLHLRGRGDLISLHTKLHQTDEIFLHKKGKESFSAFLDIFDTLPEA